MAQQNFIGRLLGNGSNGSGQAEVASEIIGRSNIAIAQASFYKSRLATTTFDETIPDYEFYDKLRRGKQPRYRLGGLFAKRIESVFASWVLGRGVEIELQEEGNPDNPDDPRTYTNGLLADFVKSLFISDGGEDDIDENGAIIFQLYRDGLGLGDQYIIVNVDGSLSIPSPDTVEVKRDPLDYRRVTAVTITTKTAGATIEDKYEADARMVMIKTRRDDGTMQKEIRRYPNLFGRIPVVHFAHGRSANETNGHPIHEELLPLYDQYDAVIYKTIDGAKLLGNPILVFQGLEDLKAVIDANKPATYDTYQDKDGNEVTHTQLNIDENSIILLGKGGEVTFAGPAVGFSKDTRDTLKSLFLLLLDHTGIPEFIWGNEVSSGRSSSETQLTQWVRDIEARQKGATGPLLKLCGLWLQAQALTDPKVVVDKLTAEWPPLIEEDEEQERKRIELAVLHNLVTDKTALSLLGLVEDASAETKAARDEADARQAAMFPDGTTAAFQQQLQPQPEGANNE